MTAERMVYDEILLEKIYIHFAYGLYVAGRIPNASFCGRKCELYAELYRKW